MPAQDIITKVEIWPVDVPITDPFVVATGRLVTAQNLFVRITLKSGARGYGEIAPFPEVGGDDRPTCLQIATQLALALLGHPAAQYRKSARLFHDMAAAHPAARCRTRRSSRTRIRASRGRTAWPLCRGSNGSAHASCSWSSRWRGKTWTAWPRCATSPASPSPPTNPSDRFTM